MFSLYKILHNQRINCLNCIAFLCFMNHIKLIHSQQILGCGGFVKSSVPIKFDLIEVKLYTKTGGLKYSTDLAPHNGYYTIPVYDNGDYLLKVESPLGWKFEPSSVELHIDGKTDPCSQQKDVNFNFVGFGIIGQVISEGQVIGPVGLKINLKDNKSKIVLQSTVTELDGKYTFTNVLPGTYEIEALHDKWMFEKSKTTVTVSEETGNAGKSIVVHGFDVIGQVLSDGEPAKNVQLLLYSEKSQTLVKYCDHAKLERFEQKPLCFVTSNSDGTFMFPALPCGKYELVPFYKGDLTTYEVHPSKYLFEVNHNSVHILTKFTVAGFVIKGKILVSKKGVHAARVILDGKDEGLTRQDGTFSIDGIRKGVHTINVIANGLHFDKQSINVSPTKPELEPIFATKLDICGEIESSLEREIIVLGKDNKQITSVIETGAFCIPLPPGDYVISVKEGDLPQMTPKNYKISVVDEPLTNIIFSMFLATIKGKVKCIGDCNNVQVVLIGDDRRLGAVKHKQFEFIDVTPGNYKIEIVQERFCWKEDSVNIKIINENVENLLFEQIGFGLSLTTSHNTKMIIIQNDIVIKEIQLKSGSNLECVPKTGNYILKPKSCHKFEQMTYNWDTNTGHAITLKSVAHLFRGEIHSKKNVTDMRVYFESNIEKSNVGPIKGEKINENEYVYSFEKWVHKDEKLIVKPSSTILLFKPISADFVIQGTFDCDGIIAKFESTVGIFKKGFIKPNIQGVNVTVSSTDGTVKISLETDIKGSFSFGPLVADKTYEVTAEKEGYVISNDGNDFKAFKLAEVIITIIGENQEPLDGVLVSLSSDNDYRNNKVTSDNGQMNFLSLGPGKYYLRTMKKEYEFKPASRMLTVEEGESIKITIKGIRVAFSVFGKITSLNQTPEPRIFLEAIPSMNSCTQEESQTDDEGKYRIRGLHPNCVYKIQVKQSQNHHIERTSPEFITVQVTNTDIESIDLIAFRRFNQMDISGRVNTLQKYWSSLTVHLLKDGELVTSITSITPFFYTSVVRDDTTEYVIKIISNLPKSQYHYNTPQLSFIANCSYSHFVLDFYADIKKGGDHELSSSSLLPLFLLLIGLLVYLYPQLTKPQELIKDIQSIINKFTTQTQILNQDDRRRNRVQKNN